MNKLSKKLLIILLIVSAAYAYYHLYTTYIKNSTQPHSATTMPTAIATDNRSTTIDKTVTGTDNITTSKEQLPSTQLVLAESPTLEPTLPKTKNHGQPALAPSTTENNLTTKPELLPTTHSSNQSADTPNTNTQDMPNQPTQLNIPENTNQSSKLNQREVKKLKKEKQKTKAQTKKDTTDQVTTNSTPNTTGGSNIAGQKRTITIKNGITPKMLAYSHWTGKYRPTTLVISIDGHSLTEENEFPVEITDNKLMVTYRYSFMKGYRTGARNIHFNVNPNTTTLNITFAWKNKWHILCDQATPISAEEIEFKE